MYEAWRKFIIKKESNGRINKQFGKAIRKQNILNFNNFQMEILVGRADMKALKSKTLIRLDLYLTRKKLEKSV